MTGLVPFWFIVIAFFWTGFFILEGFDFGVGMLHSLVGTDDASRRAAINTIGPLWDGNEVWLIVAGAGMFAAFPGYGIYRFPSAGAVTQLAFGTPSQMAVDGNGNLFATFTGYGVYRFANGGAVTQLAGATPASRHRPPSAPSNGRKPQVA